MIGGDDRDAAHHALQNAALRDARWGCSTVAHEVLGWCGRCPDVDLPTELVAWRLHAMGHGMAYSYAVEVARASR